VQSQNNPGFRDIRRNAARRIRNLLAEEEAKLNGMRATPAAE
jgi:hypothetical protein